MIDYLIDSPHTLALSILDKNLPQNHAGIMERGPRFTELEYRYVIGLSIRSSAVHSGQPGAQDNYTKKLHQVFVSAAEHKSNQ